MAEVTIYYMSYLSGNVNFILFNLNGSSQLLHYYSQFVIGNMG